MKKDRKEVFKYDYEGSCAPGQQHMSMSQTVFSVGIFQWVPTTNGKGLKKSAVVFRVKGYVNKPETVYAAAEDICDKLDNKWVPDVRSITVK